MFDGFYFYSYSGFADGVDVGSDFCWSSSTNLWTNGVFYYSVGFDELSGC